MAEILELNGDVILDRGAWGIQRQPPLFLSVILKDGSWQQFPYINCLKGAWDGGSKYVLHHQDGKIALEGMGLEELVYYLGQGRVWYIKECHIHDDFRVREAKQFIARIKITPPEPVM